MAVDHLLQVGADGVEIVGDQRLGHDRLRIDRFQPHQRLTIDQVIARCSEQCDDAAGIGRMQQVLHLHGFEHADLRTGGQHVTDGDLELHQPGRHRRVDRELAGALRFGLR